MRIARLLAISTLIGLMPAVWGSSQAQHKPGQTTETEIEFWKSVKDSKSIAEISTYLDRYPYGVFATLARARIGELTRSNSPAPSPAAGPVFQPGASLPAGIPTTGSSPSQMLYDRNTLAGMTPDVIREVQQKLYDLGLDIKKIDGTLHPETRSAIRVLQSSIAQAQSGELTVTQLNVLRAAKAPDTWGAIAYDAGGVAASRPKRPDRKSAETEAREGCKKVGGKACEVAVVSGGRCAAFGFAIGRIGNTNHRTTAMGFGNDPEEAFAAGVQNCKTISKTPGLCKVVAEGCADGRSRAALLAKENAGKAKAQPAAAATPPTAPGPGAGDGPVAARKAAPARKAGTVKEPAATAETVFGR